MQLKVLTIQPQALSTYTNNFSIHKYTIIINSNSHIFIKLTYTNTFSPYTQISCPYIHISSLCPHTFSLYTNITFPYPKMSSPYTYVYPLCPPLSSPFINTSYPYTYSSWSFTHIYIPYFYLLWIHTNSLTPYFIYPHLTPRHLNHAPHIHPPFITIFSKSLLSLL